MSTLLSGNLAMARMGQFNEPVLPQPLNPSHFQLSSAPPTTLQVMQVQQGSPH
jgi:hypothetical protein